MIQQQIGLETQTLLHPPPPRAHDFHWSSETSEPPMKERERLETDENSFYNFFFSFLCCHGSCGGFDSITLGSQCPWATEIKKFVSQWYGMGLEKALLDISH